ncbi:MAG TPA: hypothetical protein VFA94_02490 [Acidimicrobiales bacterium]|nr:hypothetical protein [Acidimicrobiales bacterium]
MSTQPGGRWASPAPATRVVAGGAAFLLAALLCAIWAGAATLSRLTGQPDARFIVRQALIEPYTTELQKALAASKAPQLTVARDLVTFDVSRTAASNADLPRVLAEARANELYDKGFPRDPGVGHTQAGLPRVVLGAFTLQHHKNLKPAQTAALVGMGTALLLCAVIATGAARFALPGAAALLGYVILTWHVRLANFWVEKNSPGALLYRGRLSLAVAQPSRLLAFIAIALLVAGVVYRALIGGTKEPAKERRARKGKHEPDVAAGPAEEPIAEPAAAPSTEGSV